MLVLSFRLVFRKVCPRLGDDGRYENPGRAVRLRRLPHLLPPHPPRARFILTPATRLCAAVSKRYVGPRFRVRDVCERVKLTLR